MRDHTPHKIGLFLILAVLFSSLVVAQSVTNVINPSGAEEITDSRTISFQFDIEDPTTGCWFNLGLSNGSYLVNSGNSTLGNLSTTKSQTSSYIRFNRTQAVPIDSDQGNSHNWTVFCGATASTASEIDTFLFTLHTVTPVPTAPTEDDVESASLVDLGITTNTAVDLASGNVCQYRLGLTNGTLYDWLNLNVSGTANTTFVNGSTIPMINSSYGNSHNITYRCNATGGWATTTTYDFKMDEVNPSLSIVNTTVSDSTALANLTVIDNTTASCTISADGTSLTATVDVAAETGYCSAEFDGDDISADGNFTVSYDATDGASNSPSASTRVHYRKTLYEGWNMVGWGQQVSINFSAFCDRVDGCTSVSTFSNGPKVFTTYSTSAPTVNDEATITRSDVVFVKVSANTYFIQEDFFPDAGAGDGVENTTMWVNGSAWNVVSITDDANLTAVLNQNNVSTASYYNGTNYLTCSSTSLCTLGITDTNDIDLPVGSAVWITAAANDTYNRTAVTD